MLTGTRNECEVRVGVRGSSILYLILVLETRLFPGRKVSSNFAVIGISTQSTEYNKLLVSSCMQLLARFLSDI